MTREYSSRFYKTTPRVEVLECICSEYGKHQVILEAFICNNAIERFIVSSPDRLASSALMAYEASRFFSVVAAYLTGKPIKELECYNQDGLF